MNGLRRNWIIIGVALLFIMATLTTIFAMPIISFADSQFNNSQVDCDYNKFYADFLHIMRDYPQTEEQSIPTGIVDENDESFIETNRNEEQTDVDSSLTETNCAKRLNRLIVHTKENIDSFGAVAKAEYNGWHFFQYSSKSDTDNAFTNLKNLDYDVSYDEVVRINENENTTDNMSILDDEVFGQAVKSYYSWGAQYIGWSEFTTNMLKTNDEENLNKIVIAVLDSGINTKHDMFKGRLATDSNGNYLGKDFTGEITNYDVSSGSYNTTFEDLNGHGSHVSGTIAEATLSNVKILPLKVLKGDGTGSVSMIVSAINYLIDVKNGNKASGISKSPNEIVAFNMSIGLEATKASDGSYYVVNKSLENKIISAYNNNIMPIISAGNDAIDIKNITPANIPQALVVSALKLVSSGNKKDVTFDSSYSNFGENISFSAPGSQILSAYGGKSAYDDLDTNPDNDYYQYKSGTSMAAPHVTACFALVCSNPLVLNLGTDGYTKEKMTSIVELLKDNAVDYGVQGWDKQYGYGCINISEIGMDYSEEIVKFVQDKKFSDEKFPTSSFNLTFSYSVPSGYSSEIYYTLEDNDISSLRDGKTEYLYNNKPISISQTTKVTAYAYMKDGSGKTVQKSTVSEIIYYFNNLDIDSNFELNSSKKIISLYKGDLTDLTLPERIFGSRIVAIGGNAFSNSNVKVLRLSTSIEAIGEYAFSDCPIEEIYAGGIQFSLGNYAFQNCTSLRNVTIENLNIIGDGTFQNCTSLKTLQLMKALRIGKQAFSGSGIKDIYIGKNVYAIGEQKNFNVQNVYGFANHDETVSVSQQMAYNLNAQFIDLSARIIKDINKQMVINSSSAVINFSYSGYNAKAVLYMKKSSGTWQRIDTSRATTSSISGEPYGVNITFTLTGIDSGTQIRFDIYDYYGEAESNRIQSQTMEFDVVSASENQTFTISFSGAHVNAYINEMSLGSQAVLYKNSSYTLKIVPENGYMLSKVVINSTNMSGVGENEYQHKIDNVNQTISVTTTLKPKLTLTFSTVNGNAEFYRLKNGSNVRINGADSVTSGEDYTFKVSSNNEYEISHVTANGKILTNNNGYYTLSNITLDYQIVVTFNDKQFKINVTIGNGGNLTVGGSLEYAKFGSTKTYHISVSEGYMLDYVMINGDVVNVKGGQSFDIPIENISQNYDIVVSFKKLTRNTVFNREFVTYFFIFLFIVIVFVIAKIILTIVRKKEKEKKKQAKNNSF